MRVCAICFVVGLLVACSGKKKQDDFLNKATTSTISQSNDTLATAAKDERGLDPGTFLEYIASIPMHKLPLKISCGLDQMVWHGDYSPFEKFIPSEYPQICGRLETSRSFILVFYGFPGDDVYPALYSYDTLGQVLGVLQPSDLILSPCGAADENQVPHSFILIDRDLTITLIDTTRFTHHPENRNTDHYRVDSIQVTRKVMKVSQDGSFVTIKPVKSEVQRKGYPK